MPSLVCRILPLAGLLVLLSGFSALAAPNPIDQGWATYRSRFVTGDGRVLDTGNNEISHTEGQGWAMLFAETANDRASFDKIWEWTRTKLQRHDNALFSWSWNPDDKKQPVADRNDASDGDILIAWALVRAAQRWHEPEFAREAHRIIEEIRRHLLVSNAGHLVLLPGVKGFRGKDGNLILNPSYYIYPALADFARVLPSPEWRRLEYDGLGLLGDARFGRWGLTPDWLDDHRGDLSPATQYPARFGFDAIRIPLYLIWGGKASQARLASYLDFWNGYGAKPIPAWADVQDNSVAPYAASTGFNAIVALARSFGQPASATLPAISDKDDYYSASLTLLAAIAQQEAAR